MKNFSSTLIVATLMLIFATNQLQARNPDKSFGIIKHQQITNTTFQSVEIPDIINDNLFHFNQIRDIKIKSISFCSGKVTVEIGVVIYGVGEIHVRATAQFSATDCVGAIRAAIEQAMQSAISQAISRIKALL